MKFERDTWDRAGYCTVLDTRYMYICTCTYRGCKGVSSGRKQFKIYGPDHFRYTWEKYLEICARDGTNASKEIRAYVEGQVARRDPGNPQPPLTAFIEGHDDEVAKRRSDLVKELIVEAEKRGGFLEYKLVVEYFRERHHLPGHRLVAMAKSMCQDLKKLGVKITY